MRSSRLDNTDFSFTVGHSVQGSVSRIKLQVFGSHTGGSGTGLIRIFLTLGSVIAVLSGVMWNVETFSCDGPFLFRVVS